MPVRHRFLARRASWRLAVTVGGLVCGAVLVATGCGGSSQADAGGTSDQPASAVDRVVEPSVTAAAASGSAGERPSGDPTAAPALTPTATGGRGQPEAIDGPTSYVSIRDVDFMNGFTYATGVDYVPVATVVDGAFQNGAAGAEEYFWFGVTQVDLGDLDGDGAEEAIVATSWNGGGTGFFDSVIAYRLVDGMVEEAGRVMFGDRADGGIHDVRIEDGVVSVWSFSTTLGACCPNEVAEHRLVLGEHSLVTGDRGTTRRWMSLEQDGEELRFLPGTRSAVVVAYGSQLDGRLTFEAVKDQRVSIRLIDGPAADVISLTPLSTGETVSGLADVVLPVDGFYEVRVAFDAERDETTTFEIVIDAEPESPVTWTPKVEQVVVSDEPAVYTSLVWPEFESTQTGTAAANEALATYVAQLDDYWIEDVTEFSSPQDDSTYELSYQVTLAADDLASVRFDFYDYVCCRPYPNYGPRGVVVDLAAGRLVTAAEILDPTRVDEINEIWITELDTQGLLGDSVAEIVAERPRFDSLTLLPDGVEFGTERNSLGGGMPGTSTFVSYEQLGDLIDPSLVARVTTG